MPDLKKPNDKDKGVVVLLKIIAQMKSLQTTTSNPMITTKQKLDRVLITLGSAIVAILPV